MRLLINKKGNKMKIQKTILATTLVMAASVAFATAAPEKKAQTFSDGLNFLAAGEVSKGIDAIKEAANDGDVYAQYNLGDLYTRGIDGLEKNTESAKKWLKAASDNGLDIAKKQYEYLESLVSEEDKK